MESIIGAGILGDLRYSEQELSWAVDLGQKLHVWAEATSNENLLDHGNGSASRLQAFITAIDRLLARHGVYVMLSSITASTDGDVDMALDTFLNNLLSLKGQVVYAVVVIAQCAASLAASTDENYGEHVINDYMEKIGEHCSELGIALDALEILLLQQPKSSLKAGGVRKFLSQLSKPLSILVMSSDPRDEIRLRLGEERRELEEAITRTRFRDHLVLHDMPSCRVRDITTALDKHSPNILHFSGHGENSELFFEDDRGDAIAVDKTALAELLAYQKSLKLVILNACYSQAQAQAIADAVGYVIGMEGPILDSHAIDFSREFYAALGYGRTFEDAFERARSALRLTTTLKPHLLTRLVKANAQPSPADRSRQKPKVHLSQDMVAEYDSDDSLDTQSPSVSRQLANAYMEISPQLLDAFSFASFSPQQLNVARDLLRFVEVALPVTLAAHSLPIYCPVPRGKSARKQLVRLMKDLQQLVSIDNLRLLAQQTVDNEKDMPTKHQTLKGLGKQCSKVVEELTPLLNSLETELPSSAGIPVSQSVKSAWANTDIDRIEQRLAFIANRLYKSFQNISRTEVMNYVNQLEDDHTRFRTVRNSEVVGLVNHLNIVCEKISSAIVSKDTKAFSHALITLPIMLNKIAKFSYERFVLRKLFFLTMDNRQYAIPSEHAQTFRWIFQPSGSKHRDQGSTTNFVEWLRGDDNLFWITGKPGSGKSTLMKYLAAQHAISLHLQESQWLGSSELVIAKFFFWSSAKDPLQKSQAGLLRSILFHILRKCPDLIPVAFPFHEYYVEETIEDLSIENCFDDVQTLIHVVRILSKAGSKHNKKFFLFIDGLDEYDGITNDVIQLITALQEFPMIRLCISSRPWNEFNTEFGSRPWKLSVDELTKDDIRTYVEDKLSADPIFGAVQRSDKRYPKLVHKIVDSADGVFLWVFLVVRSLLEGLTNADTIVALQKRLADFPTDLEAYFEKILLTVHGRYRQQMANAFMVSLDAATNLPVLCYWFFDELDDDLEYVFGVNVDSPSEDETIQRITQSTIRLNARCKGLLEVRMVPGHTARHSAQVFTHYVDFLHRTARDFLALASMQQKLKSWASESYNTDANICASIVAVTNSAPSLQVADQPRSQLMYTFFFHMDRLQQQADHTNHLAKRLVLELEQTLWTRDIVDFDFWSNPTGLDESFVDRTSSRAAIELGVDLGFMVQCAAAGSSDYITDRLVKKPELVGTIGPDLLIIALHPSPTTSFSRHKRFSWGQERTGLVSALIRKGVDPNQGHHMRVISKFPSNLGLSIWQQYLSNMIAHGTEMRPEERLDSLESFECCKILLGSNVDPCALVAYSDKTKKGFHMLPLYEALRPVFTDKQYLSLSATFRLANAQDFEAVSRFLYKEGLDNNLRPHSEPAANPVVDKSNTLRVPKASSLESSPNSNAVSQECLSDTASPSRSSMLIDKQSSAIVRNLSTRSDNRRVKKSHNQLIMHHSADGSSPATTQLSRLIHQPSQSSEGSAVQTVSSYSTRKSTVHNGTEVGTKVFSDECGKPRAKLGLKARVRKLFGS